MKKISRILSAAAGLAIAVSGINFDMESADADVTTIKGDLNGDGVVDVMDRVYMKKYLINDSIGFPVTNWRTAADLNNDSSIDYTDLNLLRDFMLDCNAEKITPERITQYNGIDVSRWQGDINWEQVKAAGIDFVMIKAGDGTQTESSFIKNITGAKNAGIQCGIYWFANARSVEDAHTEAKVCLDVISKYQLEYPVVYDFEYGTLNNNNPLASDRVRCTEAVNAFLGDIEAAGWYAMVYTNKDFPQRYLNLNEITSRYALWYANYSISQPDVQCSMWQYSCRGRVDGIAYDVDLNVSYVDFRSKMVSLGFNGFEKPEPPAEEQKPENEKTDPPVIDEGRPSGSEVPSADGSKLNINDIKKNTEFWNEWNFTESSSETGVRSYNGEKYGVQLIISAEDKTGYVISADAYWGENESAVIKDEQLYNSSLRGDIQRILTGICGYDKTEAMNFLKSIDLSDSFDVKDSRGNRLMLSYGTKIIFQIKMK